MRVVAGATRIIKTFIKENFKIPNCNVPLCREPTGFSTHMTSTVENVSLLWRQRDSHCLERSRSPIPRLYFGYWNSSEMIHNFYDVTYVCTYTEVYFIKTFYHSIEHYSDVMMCAIASQITSISTVYSAVCSGTHQRNHQSSELLAFVSGDHWWLVESPHKGPVTRKMFQFDDVIIWYIMWLTYVCVMFTSYFRVNLLQTSITLYNIFWLQISINVTINYKCTYAMIMYNQCYINLQLYL